ncbi:MAG: hypothetical protein IJ334_04535, partial [Clostridia bacterium]|nr:hypothetical protein [Clostridia bacterium]
AGYTCHLVCYNITGEQAEALQKSKRTYSKNYDGAFEIEYITPIVRSYDTLYDVGIRLVVYPNTFYKSDLIICYNSFMQNYRQYLCQTAGVELTLTPLYYKEADYKFSTLVYHIVDAIGFRRGSTITTVLDTEADYLVTSPLGLDPERISETTIHFFKSFGLVLLIGLGAVTAVVYLESEHMRFDFSVFAAFGADNKRLAVYMLYKMLILSLLIQLPCIVLSYIAGLLRYGLLVFSVSPVLFLRSMLIVMVMLESVAAAILKIQTEQTVIRRMTSENNDNFLLSPRKTFIFQYTESFTRDYTFLCLKRYAKFYGIIFLIVGIAALLMNRTADIGDTPPLPGQYTVHFPYKMEYEVFEQNFVHDILSVNEHLMVQASITETSEGSAVLLKINGDIAENCVFAAAGESLYQKYPETRDVIRKGNVVVFSSDTPDSIEILKPVQMKGSIPERLTGEKLLSAYETAYTYETISCKTYPIRQEGDAVTVYLPFSLYKEIFGIQPAEITLRHIRLPETYTETTGELNAEKYKSTYYTDDVSFVCEYYLEHGEVIEGDFSDILFDENAVVVRGSRSELEALGLSAEDRLEISTAGRGKAGTKDTTVPLKLTERLRKLSYSYKNYRVCAVILDETEGIEILMHPLLYETITGCDLAYNTAEIILTENTADTKGIASELRRVAGQYYETYMTDNDTQRKTQLLAEYDRQAEEVILSGCVGIISILLIQELFVIFEKRRDTEKLILRTYGGTEKQIKKLFLFPHIVSGISDIV